MGLFNRHKQKQQTLEIERLNREIEQLKKENKAYQEFVEQTYYYGGSYPAIKLVSEFRYLSPSLEDERDYASEKYDRIQHYLFRYLTAYLSLLATVSPDRAYYWEQNFDLFLNEIKNNINKHPPRHLAQFDDFK
ncbi:hypothetical protein AB7W58_19200 [Providencia rettgeri]